MAGSLQREVEHIEAAKAARQAEVAARLTAIRREWDESLLPLAEAAGFTLEEAKGLIDKVGYKEAARMMAHNALRPVPGPDELIPDPEPAPRREVSNWMRDWQIRNE